MEAENIDDDDDYNLHNELNEQHEVESDHVESSDDDGDNGLVDLELGVLEKLSNCLLYSVANRAIKHMLLCYNMHF